MLKKENIDKYDNDVKIAIEELWKIAFTNQKYENDLVLIIANGTKTNYSEETPKSAILTNYQIGHDFVHYRYITFTNFFNQYKIVRNNEYVDIKKNKRIFDEIVIQMQLLSYMKFWESDLILKRLVNLSRLSQGKEYSWDITQQKLNNRRILVKDKIQKPIETHCPNFYRLIDNIYSRQLRNAIAHSQYYIMYDAINLTNKEENQYYKLDSITFERWDEIFTKLILMHEYMIINFNKYYYLYINKAENKHNGLRIVFPEKNCFGFNKSGWLKFDKDLNKWDWNREAKS